MRTAALASAAFSPSEAIFPLGEHRQSARLRQALCELGSDAEFRDGVAPLRTLGVITSFKTIERVSESVGSEVAVERHGAEALAHSKDEHPDQRAELLVLQADAVKIRFRLSEEEQKAAQKNRPTCPVEALAASSGRTFTTSNSTRITWTIRAIGRRDCTSAVAMRRPPANA